MEEEEYDDEDGEEEEGEKEEAGRGAPCAAAGPEAVEAGDRRRELRAPSRRRSPRLLLTEIRIVYALLSLYGVV